MFTKVAINVRIIRLDNLLLTERISHAYVPEVLFLSVT